MSKCTAVRNRIVCAVYVCAHAYLYTVQFLLDVDSCDKSGRSLEKFVGAGPEKPCVPYK